MNRKLKVINRTLTAILAVMVLQSEQVVASDYGDPDSEHGQSRSADASRSPWLDNFSESTRNTELKRSKDRVLAAVDAAASDYLQAAVEANDTILQTVMGLEQYKARMNPEWMRNRENVTAVRKLIRIGDKQRWSFRALVSDIQDYLKSTTSFQWGSENLKQLQSIYNEIAMNSETSLLNAIQSTQSKLTKLTAQLKEAAGPAVAPSRVPGRGLGASGLSPSHAYTYPDTRRTAGSAGTAVASSAYGSIFSSTQPMRTPSYYPAAAPAANSARPAVRADRAPAAPRAPVYGSEATGLEYLQQGQEANDKMLQLIREFDGIISSLSNPGYGIGAREIAEIERKMSEKGEQQRSDTGVINAHIFACMDKMPDTSPTKAGLKAIWNTCRKTEGNLASKLNEVDDALTVAKNRR